MTLTYDDEPAQVDCTCGHVAASHAYLGTNMALDPQVEWCLAQGCKCESFTDTRTIDPEGVSA